INMAYWFDLRFIRPLTNLRNSYQGFIRGGELAAVHRVHLENHRAPIKDLPAGSGIRLLPPLERTKADTKDKLCYVLLGSVIDFVKPEENTKGIRTLYYAKWADGVPISDVRDLGSLEPMEASEGMSPETFEIMKIDIDEELVNSYQHVEKKKT